MITVLERMVQWLWPDPIVPGCLYRLPDGQRAVVYSVDGFMVGYVVACDGVVARYVVRARPGFFRLGAEGTAELIRRGLDAERELTGPAAHQLSGIA